VWPSAGADHGVVSVTAGARFWHCDRQSDRVRIGAWGNRTHFGLYAHGAVSMIASAASRCVLKVPRLRSSQSNASKPSFPRARTKPRGSRPPWTLIIGIEIVPLTIAPRSDQTIGYLAPAAFVAHGC